MNQSYVINLDRRTDRMEQFKANNGEKCAQRISAVENRKAPANGCLNSHLKILKLAKEQGLDHVYIFEDDTVLRQGKTDSLKEAVECLEAKQPGWEILLFSISYGAHMLYTDMGTLIDSLSYMRVNSFFNGTYCMVVSHRCFDQLIELIESRKDEDIDVDIEIYSSLCDNYNVFLTLPFLAEVVPNGTSDLRKYDTTDELEKVLWCEKVLMINNDK
jgi:GR25 family glycosyltransferase involved in LPS biosynthesis